MIKIKDIVKYKTPMNPSSNWGLVKEILTIENSMIEERISKSLYRIVPLENSMISYYDATREEILEVYSKGDCMEEVDE